MGLSWLNDFINKYYQMLSRKGIIQQISDTSAQDGMLVVILDLFGKGMQIIWNYEKNHGINSPITFDDLYQHVKTNLLKFCFREKDGGEESKWGDSEISSQLSDSYSVTSERGELVTSARAKRAPAPVTYFIVWDPPMILPNTVVQILKKATRDKRTDKPEQEGIIQPRDVQLILGAMFQEFLNDPDMPANINFIISKNEADIMCSAI